jgi:hypothetical protein
MWLILGLVMLGAPALAEAQDVRDVPMGEIGGSPGGLWICSYGLRRVTAISEEKSPNPKAPRFKDVANTSGMTPTALKVWLQNENHPMMPNIMIRGQDLRNLTAYILSLKD